MAVIRLQNLASHMDGTLCGLFTNDQRWKERFSTERVSLRVPWYSNVSAYIWTIQWCVGPDKGKKISLQGNKILRSDLGEVDIIEGINDQGANAASLHTTEGCTQPQFRAQTGYADKLNKVGVDLPGHFYSYTQSTNCSTKYNFNQACSTLSTDPASYGPNFNTNGGGWYAWYHLNSFHG